MLYNREYLLFQLAKSVNTYLSIELFYICNKTSVCEALQ